MAEAHGLCAACPSGTVSSPSLSPKERGPGGEFRSLLNRKGRKVRNVFFIFPWRSLRPSRFQGKSVKMNFDDPRVGSPAVHLRDNILPEILRSANAPLENDSIVPRGKEKLLLSTKKPPSPA